MRFKNFRLRCAYRYPDLGFSFQTCSTSSFNSTHSLEVYEDSSPEKIPMCEAKSKAMAEGSSAWMRSRRLKSKSKMDFIDILIAFSSSRKQLVYNELHKLISLVSSLKLT